MSRGSNHPAGVRTFGHKSMDDGGKFHPDTIKSGQETVDKQGGSASPAVPGYASRARAVTPKGVVRGDGTETLKGITVKKVRGNLDKSPLQTKKSTSSIPGGVKQHDGKKAPRSVK